MEAHFPCTASMPSYVCILPGSDTGYVVIHTHLCTYTPVYLTKLSTVSVYA